MPNTNADVREAAIHELSTDYTEYNGFEDDASFQAWVLTVVDRVIARFSGLAVKASKVLDLDNVNMFEAVMFEVVSRLQNRQENQSYASVVQGEGITVGPITIRPPAMSSVSTVIKEWGVVGDDYHRRALARLAAEGIGLRRATARSMLPYGATCP